MKLFNILPLHFKPFVSKCSPKKMNRCHEVGKLQIPFFIYRYTTNTQQALCEAMADVVNGRLKPCLMNAFVF